MGLVWSFTESVRFQQELAANAGIWDEGLAVWEARIGELESLIGSGPGAVLAGQAYNAAKTLFVERVLPIMRTGRTVCSWIGFHLEQYRGFELSLLADGSFLDEDGMAGAVDTLERQVTDIATRWHYPFEDSWVVEVSAMRNQIAILKDVLGDLRMFDRRISGLFRDEIVLSGTLAGAVRSISTGTVSSSGAYVPSSGDREPWLQGLLDYESTHPRDPQPVFGEVPGRYGGDQGSLYKQWKNMSPEEKQRFRDVVRHYYPDFTVQQIDDVIFQSYVTGCGYTAAINSVLWHYSHDPARFKNAFGFDLYNPDGTVNFEELLLDFWCYTQHQSTDINPTGGPPGTAPTGIFPAGGGDLQNYLADHGVTITTSKTTWAGMADYYQFAHHADTVLISVHPVLLYDVAGVPRQWSGNRHAMVVTGQGTDTSGRQFLIVSSWGETYKLYPDDYKPRLAYHHIDLDGDGDPDWVFEPYFTMEGIRYG